MNEEDLTVGDLLRTIMKNKKMIKDLKERVKVLEKKEINFIKTKGRMFDEDTKGNSKEDRRKKKR